MNESKAIAQNKTAQSNIKPLILSAFVFPGLGQLSQGKKTLGFIIIAACVICLYIVLGEATNEMNAAAQRILNSGSIDPFRIQEEAHDILLHLKTFKFLAALYSLIALWVFSMINIFKPINRN